MFQETEHIDIRKTRKYPETKNNMDSRVMVREGASDINIKEKPSVLPGIYELEENGATFSVGFEMLNGIKRFFRLFMKSKNNPFPTLLLWYKGLSNDEKKTVMIICRERTENDYSPGKEIEK
jgi:hypothetical protein